LGADHSDVPPRGGHWGTFHHLAGTGSARGHRQAETDPDRKNAPQPHRGKCTNLGYCAKSSGPRSLDLPVLPAKSSRTRVL
jgi:hypothetical protein